MPPPAYTLRLDNGPEVCAAILVRVSLPWQSLGGVSPVLNNFGSNSVKKKLVIVVIVNSSSPFI